MVEGLACLSTFIGASRGRHSSRPWPAGDQRRAKGPKWTLQQQQLRAATARTLKTARPLPILIVALRTLPSRRLDYSTPAQRDSPLSRHHPQPTANPEARSSKPLASELLGCLPARGPLEEWISSLSASALTTTNGTRPVSRQLLLPAASVVSSISPSFTSLRPSRRP